jgi:DNA-binding NarL/FixJ family response regulator
MIRLLVADDHPVVLTGIEGMLASQPDLSVVATASSGDQAIDLARRHLPDVALLDLRMPGGGGLAVINALRADRLPTRVLVLTTYDAEADIVPALEAGARGYLLKDVPRADLFEAVRAVARGERVLSPAIRARLSARSCGIELSARELEVLGRVKDGESNRAIARALFISEATVKTHLIHVFEKLGVNDRTLAVTRAIALGILSVDASQQGR